MARRRGIELRQGGEPILGKLPRLQPADRRDEGAFGHRLRALPNHALDLGDRERGFDRPRLVARPAAHQLHVEVVVDHPGNDRAPAQIHRVGAAAGRTGCLAHFDERAVGNADFRHHCPLRIHGVDLPVGEQEEPAARTLLRMGHRRQQRHHACRRAGNQGKQMTNQSNE
jgi:hypothetical protein